MAILQWDVTTPQAIIRASSVDKHINNAYATYWIFDGCSLRIEVAQLGNSGDKSCVQ
jgi:hypothetical protein